jgi:hypothetical protein
MYSNPILTGEKIPPLVPKTRITEPAQLGVARSRIIFLRIQMPIMVYNYFNFAQ